VVAERRICRGSQVTIGLRDTQDRGGQGGTSWDCLNASDTQKAKPVPIPGNPERKEPQWKRPCFRIPRPGETPRSARLRFRIRSCWEAKGKKKTSETQVTWGHYVLDETTDERRVRFPSGEETNASYRGRENAYTPREITGVFKSPEGPTCWRKT